MRLPHWSRIFRRHATTTAPLVADLVAVPANPSREPLAALTGSYAPVALDAAAWRTWRFGDRAWQTEAWRHYDICGSLRFVANWVGKSLSRAVLEVVELDDAGNPGQVTADATIAALATVPFGNADQRAEAFKLAAIDLFVGGECYLIGESGSGGGQDAWWVVTGRQIRRQGDQITVVRSPRVGGGIHQFRPGIDVIQRVWTPHPNDAMEPDAPTRSSIPDLRELEVLRKREFAELDSRLAGAGLLCIPDGIDLPRGDQDPAGSAGFIELLKRIMAASMRNRDTAEAVVPIIVSGDADAIDKIRHLTFWSDLSDQLLPLRKNAVENLALGLDIPPEVLLGFGSSNHWSAWAISDEAVTLHIAPPANQLAAAYTDAYLAPALAVLGADPTRYAYRMDLSALTVRPNRAADAATGHDRMLLSDQATRRAGAWADADAPDTEEYIRRLVEKLLLARPDAVLADQKLRELLGLPGGPALAGVTTGGTPPAPPEPEPDDQAPPAQPAPSETRPNPQPAPADAAAALIPVARYAVRRALAVAGGRLVPHRQRPEGVPRHRLHLHADPGGVDDVTATKLLAGAWDDLPDALEGIDVDPRAVVFTLDGLARACLTRGVPLDERLIDALFADAGPRQTRRR
jgi:hypothetical protein